MGRPVLTQTRNYFHNGGGRCGRAKRNRRCLEREAPGEQQARGRKWAVPQGEARGERWQDLVSPFKIIDAPHLRGLSVDPGIQVS